MQGYRDLMGSTIKKEGKRKLRGKNFKIKIVLI
jgi:hypothetical protein